MIAVLHARRPPLVKPFVTCTAAIAALAVTALFAEPHADVAALLRAVETRYNGARSLQLAFTETYSGGQRPAQRESGVLLLRKPGRMRWEYSSPAGKLFISDGKDVYLYIPEDNRAEKSRLKESDDLRAPLAFLLGKLDFNREFKSFEARREGENTWIAAAPKSANLAYRAVDFLATPAGEIRQVRVTGQDQSRLEFVFSNERMNPPISPAAFVFRAPAGVAIEEVEP